MLEDYSAHRETSGRVDISHHPGLLDTWTVVGSHSQRIQQQRLRDCFCMFFPNGSLTVCTHGSLAGWLKQLRHESIVIRLHICRREKDTGDGCSMRHALPKKFVHA